MKVSDIIERIGHILINHPNLLEINDVILKKCGINFRECVVGDGIYVLGRFDLEERMNNIIQMGLMETIQNNKSEALEIILKTFRNLNFSDVKQNSFVKESL